MLNAPIAAPGISLKWERLLFEPYNASYENVTLWIYKIKLEVM
ncbi:hypothetical protein [Candidatus Alkanophaga liquidiphilum]|nr:hypothetical protein [Candidatus Alkanophaga liquidiphilum]